MRRLIVLTLAATLLVGIGATTPAPAEPATLSAAKQHKKKRKAVRCRKSQVKVKVNRRTVSCRPLRASLPPPRAGDARLLLAKAALEDDLRGLRDRRGRRAPSLKRLFRKVGPRAYRTVQRAIPRGLARLNRMAATLPKVARSAAASQQPRCGGGPPTTDSYSSSSGGQKVTATLTLGALGTLDLQLQDGGYRISVRITTDECSHFEAPGCPTAAGVLDATDSSTNRVSLAVAKGDTVLMSQSFAFTGTTRMHAEVDADATLDLIDIDHTQTANIELGGSSQPFGPINLIYTGLHHARVDMPSGRYVPDLSAVDISVTARGVTSGRSSLGQAGNNIANKLDDSFATLVATELTNYRRLEKAWNVPNKCVKLQFSPASRTPKLKLNRGQQGSVSAQAVAEQGGGAALGRWTRTAQQNATFDPERVEDAEPRFSYRVTKAGKDIVVSLSVRVTSKAGVGQASWEQQTDDAPLYRGTISGTRGDPYVAGNCGGGWHFNYSARLAEIGGSDQPFPIIYPDAIGPHEGGGAHGYDETGNGTYTLEPCNNLSGCTTSLTLNPVTDHHIYVSFGANAHTVSVTVEAGLIKHSDDCGDTSFVLGFGSFPRELIGADTITVGIAFGSVFSSGTLTLTRVS